MVIARLIDNPYAFPADAARPRPLLGLMVALAATLCLLANGALAAPAAVDPYRITTRVAGPGVLEVQGLPGALVQGTTGYITNPRTWEMSDPILPSTDGSFLTQVGGARGDRLSLWVVDAQGASSPYTYFYVATLNIKNPYGSTGTWRLGQAHTHTTRSDGVDTPEAIEAAYHQAGYEFVISTDHRGTTPIFMAIDSGQTPDPDNSAGGRDLLWISGSEIGNGQVHLASWGSSGHMSYTDVFNNQRAVNATRAMGGIAAINHPENLEPGYSWDWADEIAPIQGVSLVEAYNGKPRGNDQVVPPHVRDAVDLADDFRQVWWIGADDCHDISKPTEFDRVAIVVQAYSSTLSQADLLAAADAGRIYIRETAQGPAIQSVRVLGNTVELTLADVASDYEVAWYKRGAELVKRDVAVDTVASYVVSGSEGYVRAEITRLADGKKAYTQPLFIANRKDLSVAASSAALVDNSSATVWDAGGATGSFVVDAGSVRNLNAIRIDWDGADGRRFNYEVEVSDTGEFAGEQRPAVRRTFSNRLALTLDFFDERTRYVRVLISGQSVGAGASARVKEVELFDATPARTQLYIDNVNGNDENTGLFGSPWRTFDHAREFVRPRDTLNFVQTTVPYAPPLELMARHSGKHAGATVQYRGAGGIPARIEAPGEPYGVRLDAVQWVEWTDFDISLATSANLFSAGANIVIQRNRLHDGQGRGFLGAGDFTLAYNLIYANAGEGAFLYVDETTGRVYNNVFHGNGSDGFGIFNEGAISAQVSNNISAANGGVAFRRSFNSAVTDSHNCTPDAYSGPWARIGSVAGDPKFVDAATRNYSLQLTSPCIDAGLDLNYSADFSGDPIRDAVTVPDHGSPGAYGRTYVDIGAFEACDNCNTGGGCHQ